MTVDSTPKGSDLELDAVTKRLSEQCDVFGAHGGKTAIVRISDVTALISAARKGQGEWRGIESHADGFPVLVSRPSDHLFYTPVSAFRDATGAWRVYRSPGGMTPLPFQPTHWMPLPPPPEQGE